MRKLPAAVAAMSVLLGLAALTPAAEARGGGGGFGGGGFGGHGGGFNGGGFNGGRNNFGPGGNGYGVYPGRPNPWARNVYPFVGVDAGSVYGYGAPPDNSGSSMPYDCSYLQQKAVDADSAGSSSYWWSLFNQCAHGK